MKKYIIWLWKYCDGMKFTLRLSTHCTARQLLACPSVLDSTALPLDSRNLNNTWSDKNFLVFIRFSSFFVDFHQFPLVLQIHNKIQNTHSPYQSKPLPGHIYCCYQFVASTLRYHSCFVQPNDMHQHEIAFHCLSSPSWLLTVSNQQRFCRRSDEMTMNDIKILGFVQ